MRSRDAAPMIGDTGGNGDTVDTDRTGTAVDETGAGEPDRSDAAEPEVTFAALALAWLPFVQLWLGIAVLVGAVLGREWLGSRTWSIAGLPLAAGVVTARWPRSWVSAGLVAVTAAGSCVLARTSLDTTPAPTGTSPLDDRLLATDIAPTSVLMVMGLSGALAATGVVIAVLRLCRIVPGRELMGCTVVLVLVAPLVTLPPTIAYARVVRDRADRQREERSVIATAEGTAQRFDDASGTEPPAPPLERSWLFGPVAESADVTVVPGWDALIATSSQYAEQVSTVSAISTADGTPLWSYSRFDGEFGAVAVDPAAGRVTLFAYEAILVLDLEDGREVATHRSPIGEIDQVFGGPVGSRVVATGQTPRGDRRVAVLEVATGRTLATADDPHRDCRYVVASDAGPPVLLRWGAGDGCRQPTLLTVDGARLVPLVEIEAPDGTWAGCGYGACGGGRLLGNAEASVISLAWNPIEVGGAPVQEIVRLEGGEIRWRTPITGALPPGPALVDLDEDGVVGEWGGNWHRLSLEDGTEVAREPATEVDAISTTKSRPLVVGDRVYTADCGQLVVRDLRALTIVGRWEVHRRGCPDPIESTGSPDGGLPIDPGATGSTTLLTSDGQLVVQDHRTGQAEAYTERPAVDGTASSAGATPAEPVTLAELRELPAPLSEPEALPPACALPEGMDPSELGLPLDTEGFRYFDEVPDADGDGAPDSLLLADVDGDGVDDGIGTFVCATAGNHPATGVLVLLAADRSLVSSDPVEVQEQAHAKFRDFRYVINGPVRVVTPGGPEASQITVEMLASRPEDPSCCPSVPAEGSFVLLNGRLQVVELVAR